MKCPICNVDLVMTDRQGVEIDYCPKCRGIWLDRGELDKIIEKSASGVKPENMPNQEHESYNQNHDNHSYDENHGHGGHYGGQKKKNMLGELFDF